MKKSSLFIVLLAALLVFSGGVLAGVSFEDKLQRLGDLLKNGDTTADIARLEQAKSGLVNIDPIEIPGSGLEVPTSFVAGSPVHRFALGVAYLKAGQEDRAETVFESLRTTKVATYRGYLWEEDGFNNRSVQPVLGSLARYYLYRKKPDRALAFIDRIFELQTEINRVATRENGRLERFHPMTLLSGVLYSREKDIPADEAVEFLTFVGIVYQKNNRMNQAVPMYERAVEQMIDAMLAAKSTSFGHSSDFFYLMQAYIQTGRAKDADVLKPSYEMMREREKRSNASRAKEEQAKKALETLETARTALYRKYPGYLAASDAALALLDQAAGSKDPAQRDAILAETQARLLALIVQQNCELIDQNKAILEELRRGKK